MQNKSNKHTVITLIIIAGLVLSTLTACSQKAQSTDVKTDSEDSVNQATITPTQAPDQEEEPLATATPALEKEVIPEISSAPEPDTISVKYIGNSCFYITFADGTRLVTDPYGTKYEDFFGKVPVMEADVITLSHDHSDHVSGLNKVIGDPQIIQVIKPGEPITVGEVQITGYTSEHAANKGKNTIFVYQYGDYKIVHMGETDNIASQEAIDAVKDADLILAYTGEYGTVKNSEIFKALIDLNIKVMMPQHYSIKSDKIFYGAPDMDGILKELPEGTTVTEAEEFIVSKDLEKQFVNLKNWGK